MPFACAPCRNTPNSSCKEKCEQPTTCVCQHKDTIHMKDGTVAPLTEEYAAKARMEEEKGKAL